MLKEEIIGGIIGGIIAPIVIGAAVGLWKITAPWRSYDMRYIDSNMFPPPRAEDQTYHKKLRNQAKGDFVVAKIRIKAHVNTKVLEIDIRLVERHKFRRWKWQGKREAGNTFISNVNDAQWDFDNTMHAVSRPQPTYKPNMAAGWAVGFGNGGIDLLRGDSLWLVILIQVMEPWKGHLEFRGPTSSGRRSYKRRSIELIPTESGARPYPS